MLTVLSDDARLRPNVDGARPGGVGSFSGEGYQTATCICSGVGGAERLGSTPRRWLVSLVGRAGSCAVVGVKGRGSMRFGTRLVAGVTAALVMALAGAQAISASRLPAGLYPAKAPAPGKAVPLPPGVGSRIANSVDCYPVQGFKSEANNRYVAAELGYGPFKYPRRNLYGMLRARATTVGAWEEHQFCIDKLTGCCWSIFTNANGRWASTEIDYSGRDKDMLRARATSIGAWERYRIVCIEEEPGTFAIYSTASDRYVAAELGYKGDDYGMLRARSSTVGAWEKFSRFPGCP